MLVLLLVCLERQRQDVSQQDHYMRSHLGGVEAGGRVGHPRPARPVIPTLLEQQVVGAVRTQANGVPDPATGAGTAYERYRGGGRVVDVVVALPGWLEIIHGTGGPAASVRPEARRHPWNKTSPRE